jgi:hypothetical protein
MIETVKVVCPVTEGNPHGYYVKNKEDMTDTDVLFDEAEHHAEQHSKPRKIKPKAE